VRIVEEEELVLQVVGIVVVAEVGEKEVGGKAEGEKSVVVVAGVAEVAAMEEDETVEGEVSCVVMGIE